MKVDSKGMLYDEQDIDGVTGKMFAATSDLTGAKVDTAGMVYKEIAIDGVIGRMPVVKLDGDKPTPESGVNTVDGNEPDENGDAKSNAWITVIE